MAHNNIFKYGVGYYGNGSQNCPQDGPDSCCSQLPVPVNTVPRTGVVYSPYNTQTQSKILNNSVLKTQVRIMSNQPVKPFVLPREAVGVL